MIRFIFTSMNPNDTTELHVFDCIFQNALTALGLLGKFVMM